MEFYLLNINIEYEGVYNLDRELMNLLGTGRSNLR